MKDCKHKYVFQCEDSYIPDYRQSLGTGSTNTYQYVAITQYECLCCETRFSENCVPMNSKIITKP